MNYLTICDGRTNELNFFISFLFLARGKIEIFLQINENPKAVVLDRFSFFELVAFFYSLFTCLPQL